MNTPAECHDSSEELLNTTEIDPSEPDVLCVQVKYALRLKLGYIWIIVEQRVYHRLWFIHTDCM